MFGGHDTRTARVRSAVLAGGVLLAMQSAVPVRGVSDCLASLIAKVPVTVLTMTEKVAAGHWTSGSGLGGDDLYLFDDLTYIYTEWADVEPRTIYDKGRWRVEGQAVLMLPDLDVTWSARSDRRYVAVQSKSGGAETLLLGLDRRFEIFEQLVAEEPGHAAGYLRVSSLQRDGAWNANTAARVRKDLMKTELDPVS